MTNRGLGLFGTTLLLALLVGCAKPPMAWNKAGASTDDFGRDRYDCMQQAQQRASGAYVNAYGGAAADKMVTNGQIFDSCMNSKGWTLGRQLTPEEVAAQPNPIKDAVEQMKRETQQRCASDEFKVYYAKSPCASDDMSIAQMADTSKASDIEKPVISQVQVSISNSIKKLQTAFRQYGGEKGSNIASAWERNKSAAENNFLDLYMGKITWGEFNSRRKEYNRTLSDEVAKANQSK